MKLYLPFLFILFFQCNSKVSNKSEIVLDEQITDYHSLTELQEVLSQTIPFTREELNYFFPLQVCDFLRFQIIGGLNERIGVSSVEADFIHKYDSSKHIYVEVLDGAGVNGSIFLLSSMERLKENFEEINSNERIRVFYHEGYRGFLKEKFQDSILEFELIYENRFRVKFHSGKMKKKELVDFIHEYPLGFLADSLVKRIE